MPVSRLTRKFDMLPVSLHPIHNRILLRRCWEKLSPRERLEAVAFIQNIHKVYKIFDILMHSRRKSSRGCIGNCKLPERYHFLPKSWLPNDPTFVHQPLPLSTRGNSAPPSVLETIFLIFFKQYEIFYTSKNYSMHFLALSGVHEWFWQFLGYPLKIKFWISAETS